MRYYRVYVVFDNGDGLIYDTYAENALCAVFMTGAAKDADRTAISVIVQEL